MEQKCRIKGKLPKLLMLLCMFLCSFTMAFAQKTVKGTVLDETGSSVIGANVLEKGTTNGTITDMDGNFTLKVKTMLFWWSALLVTRTRQSLLKARLNLKSH